MIREDKKRSSGQWILLGVGIVFITLIGIGMSSVLGLDSSTGRGATLSVVGLPFGVVAIIVGIVKRTKGR